MSLTESGPSPVQIARICHEVNRAFCEFHGDNSQVAWEDAPEWQRKSAIDGVVGMLQNPTRTPEEAFESWKRDKLADGWVYGPVKDAEKKEHPCIVPYHELPAEQRVKDYLFLAVIRSAGM